MMRFAFATVALTGIYALALASANPWDLGFGALLALGVLSAFRGFVLPVEALSPRLVLWRTAHFPALLLATAANIVRGTVQVSRVVLGRSSAGNAGFVEVPQGDRTEIGVVISGLLDTLSPGSVLIAIDPVENTWTIHALEASDEDAVSADVDSFYERYQRPVWP